MPIRIQVRRAKKVAAESDGRSARVNPEDTTQLELVSTQELKQILASRDDTDRRAIEQAADTAATGVLARDVNTGHFEIIDDDDLQEFLNDNEGLPELSRPADATLEPLRDYPDDEQLSLVSTQALRRVLSEDTGIEPVTENEIGFNPYDRN
jgi:hypothetical protein